MMWIRGLLGSLALAGGMLWAQPAEENVETVNGRGDLVAQLVTAANLASFGRGEMGDETGLKGHKSPEALVAAGGILLRIHAATGGEQKPLDAKATNEKGEAIPGEPMKSAALDAEARDLFDTARGQVAGDKARSAALETLIKQAQTVTKRDAVGGPRVVTRGLNPRQTHTYMIPFVPRAIASVALTSSGTSRLHFEILGNGGQQLFENHGRAASYTWRAGAGGADRHVKIRISNVGRNPASYRITTN